LASAEPGAAHRRRARHLRERLAATAERVAEGRVAVDEGGASRTPGGNIDIPSHGAAVSALAIPPALVVLLRAPAMHMELAADPVSLVSEAGHGLLPQGGTILATDNALPARVVIGTTTQIDVRPSEPIREP
jgi:hypothetical protein